MKKLTIRQTKVIALNFLREAGKELFKYEQDHFKQFIGKDIFKVNGEIKQKYAHDRKVIEFKKDGIFYNAHCWLTYRNSQHLDITIKICINGGKYPEPGSREISTAFCQYEQHAFTLFTLKDNKIEEAKQHSEYFDEVFNEEEISKKADKLKKIAEEYRKELDEFPYEFKSVFYIERLTTH